jgi:hypothetical protein
VPTGAQGAQGGPVRVGRRGSMAGLAPPVYGLIPGSPGPYAAGSSFVVICRHLSAGAGHLREGAGMHWVCTGSTGGA